MRAIRHTGMGRRRRSDRALELERERRIGTWTGPEVREPPRRFAVTPEIAFGRPGGFGDAYLVHLPHRTAAADSGAAAPVRGEDAA